MGDPAATLRALAGACEECQLIARNGDDDLDSLNGQRLALMRAIPVVAGWPEAADELRTMADTVDRLTRERDKALALLAAAVPGLERDALRSSGGFVLARVRAWLGCPMAEPHDSIRAALDYDVIIRDALAGVPSGTVNDLVERLAGLFDDPCRFDDICDGDGCPACAHGPLEYRSNVLTCPDCGWAEGVDHG